jgi:hypothetical protein
MAAVATAADGLLFGRRGFGSACPEKEEWIWEIHADFVSGWSYLRL